MGGLRVDSCRLQSHSAVIMLSVGRMCTECASVMLRNSVKPSCQSMMTLRRAVHGSAVRRGAKTEQIGYLRQRGIDVLRKPDINKVGGPFFISGWLIRAVDFARFYLFSDNYKLASKANITR